MANGTILTIETQDNLDERLRKKLNNNFSSLKDAFKKVWNIATDPYYHFDVVYPVGCLIWTDDENDPRFKRGSWSLRADMSFVKDGDEGKGLVQSSKLEDGTVVLSAMLPSKNALCYERTA